MILLHLRKTRTERFQYAGQLCVDEQEGGVRVFDHSGKRLTGNHGRKRHDHPSRKDRTDNNLRHFNAVGRQQADLIAFLKPPVDQTVGHSIDPLDEFCPAKTLSTANYGRLVAPMLTVECHGIGDDDLKWVEFPHLALPKCL